MNWILLRTSTIIEIVRTYCMQHLLSLEALRVKGKVTHLGANRSHDDVVGNGSMITDHRRSSTSQQRE